MKEEEGDDDSNYEEDYEQEYDREEYYDQLPQRNDKERIKSKRWDQLYELVSSKPSTILIVIFYGCFFGVLFLFNFFDFLPNFNFFVRTNFKKKQGNS